MKLENPLEIVRIHALHNTIHDDIDGIVTGGSDLHISNIDIQIERSAREDLERPFYRIALRLAGIRGADDQKERHN